MLEIWKPVYQFEDYYEVSNHGRVRSLDRVVNCRNNYTRLAKGRMLRIHLNRGRGYYYVRLYGDLGQNQKKYIHRLVLEAFIRPYNGNEECNHKDAIKTNNNLTNLEIVTAKENSAHAISLGIFSNQKLILSDVEEIRSLLKTKIPHKEIAESFGVSKSTIGRIAAGFAWKKYENGKPLIIRANSS